MRAHALRQLQYTSVLALCCIVLWSAAGQRAPAIATSGTALEPGSRDELNQLLKTRYETASKLLQMEEQRLRQGVTTLGHVCDVARWVRDSAIELPGSTEERAAALTNYVTLTRRLEESLDRAAERGAAALVDREAARYLRLDAEVTLLRLKHSRRASADGSPAP